MRHLLANIASKNSKNDKLDFQQDSRLRKRKGKEGPRKVRKFRKRNKNFSCYVKRLSNKYRKNSKIDKFNKILDLQAEKAKNGLEKSANFAKIAEVTRIFLAICRITSNRYRKKQE